jgi:hypothetical protein
MALISTYDLRLWMAVEDGDKKVNPKLAYISQAVEDFVDSFTNRKLEATRYLTNPDFCYYDGTGKPYLYLKAYPVSYVSSVNVDANREFSSGTLFASGDYYWEPSGKIRMDGNPVYGCYGGFARGRRNILIDFTAGYAPIVGGTHNAVVSSYPLPYDLKQVMLEMCVQSVKEGMTGVHSIEGANVAEPKFIQMLSRNSFWSNVLNKYKAFDRMFESREE